MPQPTDHAALIADLEAQAQGPFEQHAVELVKGMLKRRGDTPAAAPAPAAPSVRTIPAAVPGE